MHTASRLSLIALAFGTFGASPALAGITITSASVTAGKLVVRGTSSTGTSVKLDGVYSTPISSTTRAFKFSLNYLPPDCIVDLSLVGATGKAQAVIAFCGPKGINPRGAWRNSVNYAANDVVTYAGSSWRANAASLNIVPDGHPTAWSIFAAKGASGPAGAQGIAGPAGANGADGPQGPAGANGATGPQGPAGADGAVGPEGPAGLVPRGTWNNATTYAANDLVTYLGSAWRAIPNSRVNFNIPPPTDPTFWDKLVSKGDTGARGATGATGPAGAAGATGATGPQGVQGAAGPTGPQGATGAIGPIGPRGATGPTGPQGPSGIIDVQVLDGTPFDLAGNTTTSGFLPPLQFIGPTIVLNLTSGQRVTAAGSIQYSNRTEIDGHPVSNGILLNFCYQLKTSSVPREMTPGKSTYILIGPTPQNISAADSVRGLPAGQYYFGFCARQFGFYPLRSGRDDSLGAWFMVHN